MQEIVGVESEVFMQICYGDWERKRVDKEENDETSMEVSLVE